MSSPGQSANDREPDPDMVADLGLARFLSNWCGLWDLCGRAPCRRSRACRAAGAPCFDAYGDTVFAMLCEVPTFQRLVDLTLEAADDDEALFP